MKLYFDENIPEHVVAVVRGLQKALNYVAVHTPDELGRGAADEDIFTHVSGKGGVLITRDKKIRRRPHQLQAMIQTELGVFIFTGRAQRSLHEQAVFVLELVPRILEPARTTKRPFVFGISDRKVFNRLA